ncbi:ABC transporter substrate-binding protein [Mesorhizobium koreense]|uniref:ABC transporter substrate-binding protein n=1 Tax=Mesorhizobium koreense TaxID=3074855 RepID=UPI00287BBDEC|nr:ABC transporter substrate-binding protein [Mesorhizobium sp. WR6]
MRSKNIFHSILAGTGALALATGLTPSPASAADDLVVGLLLPFTGQYAWVGANVQPVAQMIADEVNKSGGIGGKKITFVQGDTEGTVDAGTTAAQKLIDVNNVLALVGPTSLSISGSKQLIVDNKVPMVTPTAGSTILDNLCKTVCFRTVPSDSLGGRAIARAATDSKYLGGGKTWAKPALMVGKSPAMVSFEAPVQKSFSKYGTEVAETVEYSPDKPSYRSEVQQVTSAQPDGIVLVGTPEDSARIMTNAFQSGYQGGWFVTQDQTNDDFIKLAGAELVEGIYGLEEVASAESADRNRVFEEAYKAYSGNPVKIFGTNTYDAMNVIALAMERAQVHGGEITRATIADNIRKVANPGDGKVVVTDYASGKKALEDGKEINYQGLVGPIDFDEYGNITAPFGIRQVKDGKWTTVATVPAEALN